MTDREYICVLQGPNLPLHVLRVTHSGLLASSQYRRKVEGLKDIDEIRVLVAQHPGFEKRFEVCARWRSGHHTKGGRVLGAQRDMI